MSTYYPIVRPIFSRHGAIGQACATIRAADLPGNTPDTFAPPAQVADADAAVAALEKRGARITRNGQGEIVHVELNETQVTDAGLVHLKVTKLALLRLDTTAVTNAGVAELKKALPNCDIRR